ncbi:MULTISPECIES: MBL fold metallo-hydrolase [Parachlamydia]|jgi:ribonuclease BN (tRNA processing enzyme)|uniref:Metallo-beta-lactamase domain-containing protein n=2 Tax=Parachlamydia acanthamoebae TaxID=83552 RepID=F8L0E2_PARAV|nr:MBL fold metallo-hydrolase [Parachlamydia acanthamoebae]EFB41643.1 hypothetical protein pah_c026o082 [Parachlamydia acanthamoebae str. Hall's coccus]KIA77586.1 hypothetical protein DB43_GD00170 [Parachlamydia acanthamoebae]CCB86673.1 putative uncharacterized protein [Parachlamydia acanthamoebae UV-7]
MKLLFLGTGSAFTVGDGNYHSNLLLQSDTHKNLLIDCGSDARFSLHEQNLDYQDIHDVYISHLHADHVGGLEWLAFQTKFNLEAHAKPTLYINNALAGPLWEHVLSGGLHSLENEEASLESFFHVKIISQTFEWEKIHFTLIPTTHVLSNHIPQPCFGLYITFKEKSIFITTDTQFDPQHLLPYFEKADLIFHDCETAAICSGCHARYPELATLPLAIKSKMWLYHYQPGPLPNALKDGFRGFVQKGDRFDL